MNQPEPTPKKNQSTPVWELVIADMRERDNIGRKKYGTPLQAGNGRNPLIDAYQEVLDLACYLRQEIEERKKHFLIVKAAVELVCSPSWAGVSDEDCQLEQALMECGFIKKDRTT